MANNVKGYRRLAKLSQEEMAKETEMSLTTYCYKENGRTEFVESEMKRVYEILKKVFPDLKFEELFF